METNIVRGRDVRWKNGAAERKSSRRPHLNLYADVWREERETENVRKERRVGERGQERDREDRQEEERMMNVGEGGRRPEKNEESRIGSIRCGGKREEWKCKRTDYSRREPRGPTRGQDARRMRGGRGNRVYPLSLSFHVPFAQPFSAFAFLLSCFLSYVAWFPSSFHAYSLHSLAPGPNSSPLCLAAGISTRTLDRSRTRTIQGPAGIELFVQRCSISGWSVMQIERGRRSRNRRKRMYERSRRYRRRSIRLDMHSCFLPIVQL